MNHPILSNKRGFSYKHSLFFLALISFTLLISSNQISFASSHITVNSFLDEKSANDGLCTLREAIIAANQDKPSGNRKNECPAGNGADTIILPAGTYLLSRTDNGNENSSQTGDLDIEQDLTIIGDGADVTIIDGNGITDRIIHALAGTVDISGITLQYGNVPGDGGTLFNSAHLTLTDVALLNSQATGAGGGLAMDAGSLTATAVTIAQNSANGGSGGGVFVTGGSAHFNNSTISGNTAVSGVNGIDIQATTTMNFVTVMGETAVANNTLTLDSTILAGSCSGTLTSLGHNVIEDNSCTITGDTTGNIVGQPAGLEPLANNGDSTHTHALAQDSPAVEAGSSETCPEFDQRGISRPRGIACDSGAFELENPQQSGSTLFVNSADDVDDGVCDYSHCSFREALNLANTSPVSNNVSFNIPGDNPPVIFPLSPLPVITDPIFIDGTTQPGGWVVLDGSQAGPDANGLEITAGDSTVRGLHIINFDGSGIWIAENGGNVISGNEIAHNSGNGITISESTGNQLSGNNIHDNSGLSIDLGNNGRSDNDVDDYDDGANYIQNFPNLMLAVPNGSSMTITGRLNSTPNADFTLEFFAGNTCPTYGGGSQTYLGAAQTTTDDLGNVYFVADSLTAVPYNNFVSATATDANGNTSELSDCITVSPGNTSWVTAMGLDVVPGYGPVSVSQFLDQPGQSRWYKFRVQPGSKIIVTLTELPENYDLTIYKDIAQAYKDLQTPQDLPKLDAEFAPEAFSPEAFSPEAFSPEAFSPEAFSPEAFSPEAFSPEAFSPEAFSPEVFSPEAFSPEAFSADAFSPEAFSPEAFSPEAFSPEAFSPEAFSPEAFSGAQLRSLIGISAFPGTASEGIILNSWNNTGDFYIRVRGANGASSNQFPFTVSVQMQASECGNVSEVLSGSSTVPEAGNFQTIILTDMERMNGGPDAAFAAKLAEFAARPEVGGVVVDVGTDARVAAANIQADQFPDCPFAKNLVADSIKTIIDGYREINPLAYVVIIGSDGVIPFYRYPDNALLANESNYVPPVTDGSPSQASLRLGYILGQDEYGSQTAVSFKNSTIPIPGLPVGRVVETVTQATAVIDAYLDTPGGVTPLTTSPLVTGYDFLEDAALAVQAELEVGMNQTANTLIADRNLAPSDPSAWTADDLSAALLSERHDIAYLAGHFSASGALAADYTTRMTAAELLQPTVVDMKNMIVFSAGCHSSYNIVDIDEVAGVTEQPDWAQAFASKGAVLIGGTGYQYGDTDFLEYSERLYLEFSKALRTGSGPVSVGQALVMAKQQYLIGTPEMRGIHEKALLQSTIYGLPHLSVDMPGERLSPSLDDSIVTELTAANGSGGVLGLTYADISVTPAFAENTVSMENVVDGSSVTGFYLSGANGQVASNPAEPTLPLEVLNVGVPGTYLRGVGFRGGSYTDLQNIIPFTGAPTTEIRGVHAPFQTDVLYPIQFWHTNYYDQLINSGNGSPYLSVTPAQFVSDGPGALTGTMRRFDDLGFRLYFNNNVTTYEGGSQPGQSAPPSIVTVISELSPDEIQFAVDVTGNPAAGIQEVWIVFTAVTGPYSGQWQPLDLTQNELISTRWEGSLPLNGTDPLHMRFMVQAVNGVGLSTLAANKGDLYIPGINNDNGTQTTTLSLVEPPSQDVYGSQVTLAALLTDGENALANQRVTFGLGPQARSAFTNENGFATVDLTLLGLPGSYSLQASYAGSPVYDASSASALFTVTKQNTVLTLAQPASGFAEEDVLLTATLQDANGRYLGEKTVFFVITGPNGSHSQATITDGSGRALLGNLLLSPGEYNVNIYFSGSIPLHTGDTLSLNDARYHETATSGSLTLLNHDPHAADDAYTTDEDMPLVIAAPGVLNNDVDTDGDGLTAVLDQAPAHGNVTLNADGSFTYTPQANYYGPDSFTYFASDGMGSSQATVQLTVNPVNDAPEAAADDYSVDENSVLSVSTPGVLGNDNDADGDGLTAVLGQTPAHGSLTLYADGSFSYIPHPDYFGPDSFTYFASDGAAQSAETTVNIAVNMVNHSPVCQDAIAAPEAIWSTNKEFYQIEILGFDDPDEDTLTLTVTAIFQDEPVGKGNKAPDAYGIGTEAPFVKAERDGNGDGRVYHIFFTVEDGFGGQCSGEVRLPIVPHDQSDTDAIDGGALYDSTKPS